MEALANSPKQTSYDFEQRLGMLESKLAELEPRIPDNKVSIILLSGDFDKAMAAFFMANGAAAMGMQVTMFFTFWGCTVIKKGRKLKGKKFLHKLVNLMLPGSSKDLGKPASPSRSVRPRWRSWASMQMNG